MPLLVEVSQKLLDALQDTGLSARDFHTTNEQIAQAPNDSVWTDEKGNRLIKNSQDSYTIAPPENE